MRYTVPDATPGAGWSRTSAPPPGGTKTSSATGPAAPDPTGTGLAPAGSGRSPLTVVSTAAVAPAVDAHSTRSGPTATTCGTFAGYPVRRRTALAGAAATSAAAT